ncbi:hypothetical protein [Clostridium sp.]|uniref:hypothetical protein n=1 Tax=Clostridium sp. TaxID=1506 RepID=UPI00290F3FC6|nr:hypothetical protein [Clostridium sp.]MDU4846126.1 hypothetical protein [Clostridium sp.]
MAIFNNMSITNKGQVLYAKAQAGQELHFTKMMVGSGKIDSRNPATLTTLIEPKFDVGIQEITPNTELKTATISGTINNSGVAEATYICEIGLFAQDPDEGEILYAYGTAGQYGDYYAPASMGPFSWNYQINAAIGNSSNVTIELSNLTYDYGVFNTNTNFLKLTGGNQKEINKNIDTLIANLYKLSEGAVYPVNASGTNDYTGIITGLKEYKEPLALAVKIPNDSTGACTININGLGAKAILKANGNAVTNLKANSIYTMRYNGTNFILQGEGGSGNATASDILAGKTASTDAGDIVGTMPNRGSLDKVLSLNETFNLPAGYYSGGRVTQNIPNNGAINANLNCGQSKSLPAGYTSGGTITANSLASQTPANATAAQILAGYTAWVNGNLINGNAQQKQSASGVWQIRSLASGASVSFTLPFTPSLLCALDNYSPKSYWMYSTENTNVIFSGRYSSSYTSPNCEMTISGNTITFKNDLKVVYSADINYSIQA